MRALARDLGAALGVGGHLTALRRTRVGPFDLEPAARPWSELARRAAACRCRWTRRWRPPSRAATSTPAQAADLAHGRPHPGRPAVAGTYGVFAPDGRVLGPGRREPRRAGRGAAVVLAPAERQD